jgi:hypothetical protein
MGKHKGDCQREYEYCGDDDGSFFHFESPFLQLIRLFRFLIKQNKIQSETLYFCWLLMNEDQYSPKDELANAKQLLKNKKTPPNQPSLSARKRQKAIISCSI